MMLQLDDWFSGNQDVTDSFVILMAKDQQSAWSQGACRRMPIE